MIFYPDERIGLFIDGANLHSTIKQLSFDIDYKKLLKFFQSKGRLVRTLYYTAVSDDPDYSALKPLLDWLDYNGYSLVTKPAKTFVDANGVKSIKGNMDIELVVDALEMADHLDHIIIFSGDGDFRALVKSLQSKGCRVSVISSTKTKPSMVADELRRQVDHFVELSDLESEIGKKSG